MIRLASAATPRLRRRYSGLRSESDMKVENTRYSGFILFVNWNKLGV